MSHSYSRDQARLEEVKKAFRKLRLATASGDRLLMKELFGVNTDRATWSRSLMKRAEAQGLVAREQSYERGPVLFAATPELEAILADDALCSRLIWPVPGDDEPSPEGEPAEIDGAELDEAPGAAAADGASVEEMLRALVNITFAVLENVTYTRKRLDLLIGELSGEARK
jgi:hypothetical protein